MDRSSQQYFQKYQANIKNEIMKDLKQVELNDVELNKKVIDKLNNNKIPTNTQQIYPIATAINNTKISEFYQNTPDKLKKLDREQLKKQIQLNIESQNDLTDLTRNLEKVTKPIAGKGQSYDSQQNTKIYLQNNNKFQNTINQQTYIRGRPSSTQHQLSSNSIENGLKNQLVANDLHQNYNANKFGSFNNEQMLNTIDLKFTSHSNQFMHDKNFTMNSIIQSNTEKIKLQSVQITPKHLDESNLIHRQSSQKITKLNTTILESQRDNNMGLFAQIQSYGKYPLHKMVFQKNFKLLKQCLLGNVELFVKDEINERDQRGNTPLLLAGKLSLHDQDYLIAVNILIEARASIKMQDKFDQRLSEIARQMQNIGLYSIIYQANEEKRKIKWQKKRVVVLDRLKEIPDCYFEIAWDLSSNCIPGLHKFLPSDTFKVWKIGSNLRLDFNFVTMSGFKHKRRNMSIIFRDGRNASDYFRDCDLILLNRDKEQLVDQMQDFEIEERINIINEIMGAEPVETNLRNLRIQNEPCKSFFGFHIFDNINTYKSQMYKLTINCSLLQQKGSTILEENLENTPYQNYFDEAYKMGNTYVRKAVKEEMNTELKCNLWITEQFPITNDMFLTVLKTISASGDFRILKQLQQYLSNEDLIQLCGRNGFPVKVQIPLIYSIQAFVSFKSFQFLTFENAQIKQQQVAQLFSVPRHFQKVSRHVGIKMLNDRKKILLMANLTA